MEHVFVCYAREDAEFARALAAKLKDRAIPIWLDVWNIAPGVDWDQRIDAALHGCSTLLIVLSPASVASLEVRGELRTALNTGKRIVPLLYQRCDIPRQLQLFEYVEVPASGLTDEAVIDHIAETLRSNISEPSSDVPGHPPMPSGDERSRTQRRLAAIAAAAAMVVIALAVIYAMRVSRSSVMRAANSVLVWKVGSPYRGDTPEAIAPDDLEAAAEQLGLTIDIETYPAKGFAQRFSEAGRRHALPEILAFDNYAVLEGATTPNGPYDGIAADASARKSLVSVSESFSSLEEEQGGWEYLIATSQNFAAAKNLALRKVNCDDAGSEAKKNDALLRDVTGPVLMATFAGGSGGTMEQALSRLLGHDSRDRNTPKIDDVRICRAWGNRRLAFVHSAIVFEAANSLGQRSSLFVLTRPSSSWELEVASTDIRIVEKLATALPPLSSTPQVARLTLPVVHSPPDQSRLPRFPSGPELEWETAELPVIAYLVESQFESSSRWSESAFELVRQVTGKVVRVTAPFGVGMQPHRWRVWEIAQDGSTAMSEWRTLNFTN